MNIQSMPSQISSSRPIGGRLDVTLSDVARPDSVSDTGSVSSTPQVGSIAGVLSDEENLAVATMFQSSRQNIYTVSGHTQTARATPGMHLDVQA